MPSTTYTARNSLGKNAQFDYVIMDEASQVDVAIGALTMSCARNAVIVGDSKQLPNVVTKQQKELPGTIFKINQVPDAYDYVKYSFLDSFYKLVRKRIPKTILREYYWCDPQIIGYCNQKFYQNELIVTTEEHLDTLKLMTTIAGHPVREQANQRQAEVIKEDVLPQLTCLHGEIGIISPYRHQVALLKKRNRPSRDRNRGGCSDCHSFRASGSCSDFDNKRYLRPFYQKQRQDCRTSYR